jgi:predicted enzyme related to lactoylglutathione lyase
MKLLKYDRGCQLWRRTLSSNLRSPEDRPSGGVIFGVTDIDAAAARLRDAGIRFFTHGLLDTPVCRIAWCEDPEGNNFAIHRRKPAE